MTSKNRKKQKKTKDEYVMICPKCKSIDVRQDKSTLQQIGALPVMYICNNCGHSGYGFPEVKLSELNSFEKEIDKEHLRDSKKDKSDLLDTAYGKFEVRFLWKITAPIILLLGVFLLPRDLFTGIFMIIVGIVTFYITYFKKRKLRDE